MECESKKLAYTDIKHKLHKNSMVEFDICPVGLLKDITNNGKIERRIRPIKESFE